MAFFTFSTDAEHIKDSKSGNFINKSGFYEVIIKYVIVSQSPNGSKSLDFWIENEGTTSMIYQAIRLTNNNGSFNFESDNFNKLGIVAGASDNEEVRDPVPVKLPIGKGGAMKECMVLDQFVDIPMVMRVQMEYSKYNGEIKEHTRIKNFFRVPDHATASEIVNQKTDPNVKFGSQYEIELGSADKVTYKDGLTKEDVDAWIKRGRKSDPNADENSNEHESAGFNFGKKRTFTRN